MEKQLEMGQHDSRHARISCRPSLMGAISFVSHVNIGLLRYSRADAACAGDAVFACCGCCWHQIDGARWTNADRFLPGFGDCLATCAARAPPPVMVPAS